MATKAAIELSSRAINGMFRKSLTNAGMPAYIDLACWHNPNANQITEEYIMLDQVASFRKWVGERQAKSVAGTGFICESEEFENTLAVKPRERRLDKTGQLQMVIDSMMARAPQLHARLFMNLIINGHQSTTTYGANYTYDGVNFFSSSHRDSQSNLRTVDVSDPTAPTVADCEEALIKVDEWMGSFTDNAGEPENDDAENFLILAPTPLKGRMTGALANQTIQGDGGARDNVLRQMGSNYQLMTTQRLNAAFAPSASAMSFVVIRTDHAMKPFVRQTEREIQPMAPLAEGSEYARLNRDSWLFGADGIVGYGYGLWQHAIKVTFA